MLATRPVPRIDMESGGIIAKMLLNTHDPFNGTHSYLPRAALRSGRSAAWPQCDRCCRAARRLSWRLCTMNLLLVAPRARHLDFLLEAVEAWFGRTQAAGLWISPGHRAGRSSSGSRRRSY